MIEKSKRKSDKVILKTSDLTDDSLTKSISKWQRFTYFELRFISSQITNLAIYIDKYMSGFPEPAKESVVAETPSPLLRFENFRKSMEGLKDKDPSFPYLDITPIDVYVIEYLLRMSPKRIEVIEGLMKDAEERAKKGLVSDVRENITSQLGGK